MVGDRQPALLRRLRNRNEREQYLTANPCDESHSVFPIEEGSWQDEDDFELIALDANQIEVRGNAIELPTREQYASVGFELMDPDAVHVFECCRFLSENYRNLVLATEQERRFTVPDQLTEMIVLDDWQHPNLAEKEYPSECESFQQLALALETGDVSGYRPTTAGNTHWSNWPHGGTL